MAWSTRAAVKGAISGGVAALVAGQLEWRWGWSWWMDVVAFAVIFFLIAAVLEAFSGDEDRPPGAAGLDGAS
jgi:membrane protein implicated in regulation of membrane protease activity